MKHNIYVPTLEEDILYDSTICGTKKFTSKNSGTEIFNVKCKTVIENVGIISDKFFIYDFDHEGDLYQFLKKMDVIAEDDTFDDDDLLNKTVQITVSYSEYNGKNQRRIEDIYPV